MDDWPQVRLAIRNAMKHADSVRHRIIRRAGEIVTAADVLTDEMQDLGMDSQGGDVIGGAYGGLAVLGR